MEVDHVLTSQKREVTAMCPFLAIEPQLELPAIVT